MQPHVSEMRPRMALGKGEITAMSIVAMAAAANTILSPSLTSSSRTWYGILGCSQSAGHGRLEFSCKQGMHPARLLVRCRARAAAMDSGGKEESGFGFRGKPAKDVRVMVAGSTGYIGRFVVQELARRGYNVVAIARERSKQQAEAELSGASEVCFADVTDPSSLQSALRGRSIDVVVSCLASRNGGVKDSWNIDYEATRNSLEAGVAAGASHFVLLSAICVQKPLLEFQKAKLKLEEELQRHGGVTWSIVRPTAFFKSLGGQVEIVKGGGPFVVFGDGKLCSCKPISEPDLASFISDCISDEEKLNKVLPIGGPGKAYTPLEQGELLFRIVGRQPSIVKVPIQIMDAAIGVLGYLAKLFPALEDPAEYAKIGRYYAAESMLVLDPATGEYDEDATPSYGDETLEQFFERVVKEGMAGQELGEQAPAFLQQR